LSIARMWNTDRAKPTVRVSDPSRESGESAVPGQQVIISIQSEELGWRPICPKQPETCLWMAAGLAGSEYGKKNLSKT